jgi:hypothetical protein
VSSQTVVLATRLRDFLRREVKFGELLRALAVIGPLVIAYFFLREPAVLNVGLLAISLLIPALRLGLAPPTVALHYLAILITFGALFLAAPIKPLFVSLTALAASFAGGASGIAEERVANVIIGGVFSLAVVALMEFVWQRAGAGKVGASQ